MTKIKICGITNKADACYCARAGADYLGFVFYKKSPRCVTIEKVRAIVRALGVLRASVQLVGVFVNEKFEKVQEIARSCGLDVLQFHGDESSAFLKKFKNYSVIKAFRVKRGVPVKGLRFYNDVLFLADTFKKDVFGGTGQVFDWEGLQVFKKAKKRFIVSGGLTLKNVAVLLKQYRPFGVDVSSGVEKSPGKKDHRLVREFIKAVQSNDK
jgi:phosphoribosylanthranilate isomerase